MKTDVVTKLYVSDPEIFADIFNYYVFGGEQVILPEHLTERDPAELALPYGANGAKTPVQRFRDVQKLYASKTDGKVEYVLYGVENQANIHYAMPVRNNLYDALEYVGQVDEAAKSYRTERGNASGKEARKKSDSDEFLSGFRREDRLVPSVTVTIFFGTDDWDGPLDLFAMMDVPDSRILACMNNYIVHLISPARMTDEEIVKFRSSLREVMFFIKYAKDKRKLDEIIKSDEMRFRNLERRAADVIETITKSGLKYDESEAKIDMCQAIQEMRQESRMEGVQEGIQKGLQEGIQKGVQKGIRETKLDVAKQMHKMGFDIGVIAQAVGVTEKTINEWIDQRQKTEEEISF